MFGSKARRIYDLIAQCDEARGQRDMYRNFWQGKDHQVKNLKTTIHNQEVEKIAFRDERDELLNGTKHQAMVEEIGRLNKEVAELHRDNQMNIAQSNERAKRDEAWYDDVVKALEGSMTLQATYKELLREGM